MATKKRIGLGLSGGDNWFEYEYDATNDDLIIRRNPDCTGSIVLPTIGLKVEGTLSATTVIVSGITTLANLEVTGTVDATAYAVANTAGLTGTIAAAKSYSVVGGLVTTDL